MAVEHVVLLEKSRDGRRSVPVPEPVDRPGVRVDPHDAVDGLRTGGGVAIDRVQFARGGIKVQMLDGLVSLIGPVRAGLVHGKGSAYRVIGEHDFRRQSLRRDRSPGDLRRRRELGQAGRLAPGRPVIHATAVVKVVDRRVIRIPGAHVGEEQPEGPVRLPEQKSVEFLAAGQDAGNRHFHRRTPRTGRLVRHRLIQLAARRPVERPQRGSRAAAKSGFLQAGSVNRQNQAVSCRSRRKGRQGDRSVRSGRARFGAGNRSRAVAHPFACAFIGSRRDGAAQVLGAYLAAERVDFHFIRDCRGR